MFKHVVSFRLKTDKKDMLPKAKQMILTLADLPQVKSIEVGENVVESARSFDFVIIVKFDSRHDYDLYDRHEMHSPIKEFIFGIIDDAVAVDYEC